MKIFSDNPAGSLLSQPNQPLSLKLTDITNLNKISNWLVLQNLTQYIGSTAQQILYVVLLDYNKVEVGIKIIPVMVLLAS